MKYHLEREQQLKCNVETAWHFFSSPHNLAKITPKELSFKVLTNLKEDEIFEGMIIEYTVSPILSIPLKWKTKITQVDYLKSFTDFQQKGPYKYWNHFHQFVPNEHGVLIKDSVDYELPMGFIGDITHELIVKNKLKDIFDYRYKVLEQQFN